MRGYRFVAVMCVGAAGSATQAPVGSFGAAMDAMWASLQRDVNAVPTTTKPSRGPNEYITFWPSAREMMEEAESENFLMEMMNIEPYWSADEAVHWTGQPYFGGFEFGALEPDEDGIGCIIL